MNKDTKKRIEELLSHVMERIIHRRTVLEPFDEEEILKKNPFGFRLVPVEIWKGSKFERSFVTSLGQAIFEQIAKIIAEGTGSAAENQYDTEITINTFRIEKIDELLKYQRESRISPDWDTEVEEILNLKNNKFENLKVKFDLYIKRADGSEEYYSFKTVKPNLDQTEVAKRDMLRIKCGKEDCKPYFALPFNPAGEGNEYRKAHSIPFRLFNMDNDKCVLIGKTLWNKIGEDENTYDELMKIFEEVGKKYSGKIKKDYLGLFC
jgi:hypothetical protein